MLLLPAANETRGWATSRWVDGLRLQFALHFVYRYAIITARFNSLVTGALLDGCIETLLAHGVAPEVSTAQASRQLLSTQEQSRPRVRGSSNHLGHQLWGRLVPS